MCARKLDLSAKALLQMVHLNGFSPEKIFEIILKVIGLLRKIICI